MVEGSSGAGGEGGSTTDESEGQTERCGKESVMGWGLLGVGGSLGGGGLG